MFSEIIEIDYTVRNREEHNQLFLNCDKCNVYSVYWALRVGYISRSAFPKDNLYKVCMSVFPQRQSVQSVYICFSYLNTSA